VYKDSGYSAKGTPINIENIKLNIVIYYIIYNNQYIMAYNRNGYKVSETLDNQITNVDSLKYKVSRTYKLVILGDSAVGKTSILNRYKRDVFIHDSISTIGAAFITYKYETTKGRIQLDIWDTAGQERYNSIVPMYYRGSHIVLSTFDLTDHSTLETAIKWIETIKLDSETTTLILVGNKSDKIDDDSEGCGNEALVYADKHNIPYFETSACTGENIHKMFEASIVYRLKLDNELDDEFLYDTSMIVGLRQPQQEQTGCFGKIGKTFKSIF
jgi:Ras-related protein Rab-5C